MQIADDELYILSFLKTEEGITKLIAALKEIGVLDDFLPTLTAIIEQTPFQDQRA